MGFKERRRDDLPQERYGYNVNVNRNLFDVRWKKNDCLVNLIYMYRQTYASGARMREILQEQTDSTTGRAGNALLPSVTADGAWQTDVANTYHTAELEHIHAPGLEWKATVGPLYFNTQFTANHHRRRISDFRANVPQQKTTRDMAYWFYGELTLKGSGMRLTYAHDQTLPSMLHLLDVRDAGDPLNISLGNAGLKKMREHMIQFMYGKSKTRHQVSMSYGLDFNIIRNAFGNTRYYDVATGVVTYQPRNINGNWSGKFYANYSRTLDKKNRVVLSFDSEYKYKHNRLAELNSQNKKAIKVAHIADY